MFWLWINEKKATTTITIFTIDVRSVYCNCMFSRFIILKLVEFADIFLEWRKFQLYLLFSNVLKFCWIWAVDNRNFQQNSIQSLATLVMMHEKIKLIFENHTILTLKIHTKNNARRYIRIYFVPILFSLSMKISVNNCLLFTRCGRVEQHNVRRVGWIEILKIWDFCTDLSFLYNRRITIDLKSNRQPIKSCNILLVWL